jgi:16S rRNA (adenine1518-N6/adenine1519-N6)-dimethyltransferase
VVEIGPGPGGLTQEILKNDVFHLFAIEKDQNCVQVLSELFEGENRLTIIHRDATKLSLFDVFSCLETFAENKEMNKDTCVCEGDLLARVASYGVKVISNLPYNVGTEILLNLVKEAKYIESLVLIFQKEVADRILAKSCTKDYCRLSVIVQFIAKCEKVMSLAPGSLIPAPKVNSTVVRITPKETVDYTLLEKLSLVTKAAFQARRKILKNSLLNLGNKEFVLKLLSSANISESQRPENLSVEDFVNLSKLV